MSRSEARPDPDPGTPGDAEGTAGQAGPNFEEALARLEDLVEELETGELPLEETIARFEEGQKLLRICNDLLSTAELRVKEILKRADGRFEEREWNGTEPEGKAEGRSE